MDKKVFLLDKVWYTKKGAESYSEEDLEKIVATESYQDDCTIIKIDANGCNTIDEALKEYGDIDSIKNDYFVLDFGFKMFDEIHNNYVDDNYYHIDAWKRGEEQGTVVAVVNARNGDAYFIDKMAIGDADANAAIEEVKKKIESKNPQMVLMVVDTNDNTCVPYLTTDYHTIGTHKLLEALENSIPYYIGMAEEADVEEVKQEAREAAKELCDSTGAVVRLHEYELYWEEVALV